MKKLFLGLVSSVCLFMGGSSLAFGVPMEVRQVDGAAVQVPNWSRVTFGNLGGAVSSGSVAMPEGGSVIWQQGASPADILRLGDISEGFGVEKLSLSEIQALSGVTDVPLSEVAMSEFPVLGQQSLNNLASNVPYLEDFSLQEMTPIADLVGGSFAEGLPSALSDSSLSEVLSQYPELGKQVLGSLDLSQYPLGSIPNATEIPLDSFQGWEDVSLSEVPFLQDVPLDAFPGGSLLGLAGAVMRIDFVWGPAEADISNTVSGSYQEGFSVDCKEECAHIELDDLENSGESVQSSLEGKRWISGKYQEVDGGEGCLKAVNGSKEPTGRHPFGDGFKVVLMEPDETTDVASFALYFRIKTFCGATPYFIGPFPFFSVERDGFVYLGPLSRSGESEGYSTAVPQSERVSLDVDLTTSEGLTFSDGSLVGQEAICLSDRVVRGVDVKALSESIALMLGDRGYDYFGEYGCNSFGECGRTLGRYNLDSRSLSVLQGVDLSSSEKVRELMETKITREFQTNTVLGRLKMIALDSYGSVIPGFDGSSQYYQQPEKFAIKIAAGYLGGEAVSPNIKSLGFVEDVLASNMDSVLKCN